MVIFYHSFTLLSYILPVDLVDIKVEKMYNIFVKIKEGKLGESPAQCRCCKRGVSCRDTTGILGRAIGSVDSKSEDPIKTCRHVPWTDMTTTGLYSDNKMLL